MFSEKPNFNRDGKSEKPQEAEERKSEQKPEELFKLDYAPFDPEEELKEVSKLPHEQKKEALQQYKEELISQKEGIAALEEELEKSIRKDPDKKSEDYFAVVQERAKELKLSPKQLALFQNVLEEYQARRQNIQEALEEYKDPKELFKVCFGQYSEGEIELVTSPMMIYFRCHNERDFAYIYSGKFLKPEEMINGRRKKTITKKDIGAVEKINGVKFGKVLSDQLRDVVVAENTERMKRRHGVSYEKASRSTMIHEEQHVIHSLLVNLNKPKPSDFAAFGRMLMKSLQGKDPYKNIPLVAGYLRISEQELTDAIVQRNFFDVLIKFLISRYIKSIKNWREGTIKDEVLAHYKTGKSPAEVLGTLSPALNKRFDSEYNLFSALEKKEVFEEIKLIAASINSSYKTDTEFVEVEYQDSENIYKNDLDKAAAALAVLEQNGFSRRKTINLLILEPLGSWMKLVERMIQARGPDKFII